jgi:hypothetical protein
MKKLIDGKRYNTETATLLGEGSGGGFANDFHYFSEGLYQTAKGAYFLAGRGNAASKYGKPCGDGSSRTSGDGIFPLSLADAYTWAEQHLSAEAVEDLFSGNIEDA